MPGQQKRYITVFKANVAIEVIRGLCTVSEVAASYQIDNNHVTQ